MISILMIVPNPGDATSYYRAMGPFAQMRQKEEINLVFTQAVDWSIVEMVDMVFMQRPHAKEHRQIAELCRDREIPLWIDFDDLLLDVPSDNPAHGIYSSPDIKENIVQIIRLATVVTVSTPQLKRCLQLEKHCLNERIYVIPNALEDRLAKKAVPHKHSSRFCWRGTNTHQRDVASYAGEIIEFAKKNQHTLFNWVGWNPWFVTDGMKARQAVVVPGMLITQYFDFMMKLNPSCQIVPLDNNMFNQCKSNIAWIESCLAGAVSIAPDWEEWRRPGVFTFRTPEQFTEAMEVCLNEPELTKASHKQSWDYIQENLLLSKVNQTRIRIMHALKEIRRGGPMVFPAGYERLSSKPAPALDESEVMTLA